MRVVRSDEPVRRAAELLVEAIGRSAVARPRLAIPGGSALAAVGPARIALAEEWGKVRLTWVDERCVDFSSTDSNRGQAYRSGALDAAHAPAEELPLRLDGEPGADALARVSASLHDRFSGGLDVLLLGMGDDGHVASLFPGGPAFAGARVAHVVASPKPPSERITLTLPTLASARDAILLATGRSKRAALMRLIRADPALPATHLTSVTIVTDLDVSETQ
jgi:6-phosphogluconolactonase